MHTFKQGDIVNIINCNLAGKRFVEGKAIILRLLDESERYEVRFGDGSVVSRSVDVAAQDDPERYVRELNKVQAVDVNAIKV